MQLEITIPILNEEITLDRQIRKVVDYLDRNTLPGVKSAIVIADNGSDDASPEIARRLSDEFADVHYLRLDERGVGRALKASWTASKADIIGYMDLDLATDLRHLPEAINAITEGRAQIVTGSRLKHGSKVHGRSLKRAFISRVFNTLLSFYLGTKFTDGMCGFKFLARRHQEPLMALGAKSDGWFFATELLICAEYEGLHLLDLPVTWTDDPNSKANTAKLTREYLLRMHSLKKELDARDDAL